MSSPWRSLAAVAASPGSSAGPVGVAFGPGGTMFVVDPDLCRVTAFSALP